MMRKSDHKAPPSGTPKGAPPRGSIILFHHPYPEKYLDTHWPRVGLIIKVKANGRRFTVMWGDTRTTSLYYPPDSDMRYMEVL
jgi:hypothetical protein